MTHAVSRNMFVSHRVQMAELLIVSGDVRLRPAHGVHFSFSYPILLLKLVQEPGVGRPFEHFLDK